MTTATLPGEGAFAPEPKQRDNVLLVRDLVYSTRTGELAGLMRRVGGDLGAYAAKIAELIDKAHEWGNALGFPRVAFSPVSMCGTIPGRGAMGPIPYSPAERYSAPWTGVEILDALHDALPDGVNIIPHHGEAGVFNFDALTWGNYLPAVSLDALRGRLNDAPRETIERVRSIVSAFGRDPDESVLFEPGVFGVWPPHCNELRATGVRFKQCVAGEQHQDKSKPSLATVLAMHERGRIPHAPGGYCWLVRSTMSAAEILGLAGFCAGRGDWLSIGSHSLATDLGVRV